MIHTFMNLDLILHYGILIRIESILGNDFQCSLSTCRSTDAESHLSIGSLAYDGADAIRVSNK